MQDRVDFGAIAVDSFGQALGNSMVRRGVGGSGGQAAPALSQGLGKTFAEDVAIRKAMVESGCWHV
jgi:hypothetical protein